MSFSIPKFGGFVSLDAMVEPDEGRARHRAQEMSGFASTNDLAEKPWGNEFGAADRVADVFVAWDAFAKLVLLLANHIGHAGVLREAI